MTKLVIVDDHEALREGLAALLAASGLEVVGAAGERRLGHDLVEHNDPDVALDRLRLPDGNGIELTRDLLAAYPDLGVVFYTGDGDAELLFDGLDSGARGYALKAGSMDELVAAIERVARAGPTSTRASTGSSCRPGRPPTYLQLSPREREIMHLMAEGMTAERIGEEITVSVETVRTHVRNVIRKLQARNRVHAIAIALERGEIALQHDDE